MRKVAGIEDVGMVTYKVCLSNIPAATTEIFVVILFCLFTTSFGPYGPSSVEI
jgi:hypothetical protein